MMKSIQITLKERQKESIILIGVTVTCLLISYVFFINPSLQRIQGLQEIVQTFQQKALLYDEIVRLKRQHVKAEALLGLLADRSAIIAKVSNTASKNGIKITSLIPRTEAIKEYAMLRVEVEFDGSFFSLLKCLKELEDLVPAVDVEGFELQIISNPYMASNEEKEQDQVRSSLHGKLILEIFLKQKMT